MNPGQDNAQPAVARRRNRRLGERGVLLISLLVGMTVMIILLTASAQSWSAIMQRERELELIFRGNQYVVALQQYAKEHGGAFPMELEDLSKEGPMGHRYIRQMFKDPFDKKGEWNLLYLSPNGRGAVNPNARFPAGGVLGAGGQAGGAGVMGGAAGFPSAQNQGLGAIGGSLSGGNRDRDRDRDRDDDDDSGFDRGRGGLGGATMTGPIVGVVSRSKERGFRMYYGRHHYDEWEFHVFTQQVQDPQRGRGTGMNVNPGGQIGVGGGITGVGHAGPGEAPDTPAPPIAGPGNPGN